MSADAPARPSSLAALRDRNFWPYFVGNVLSSCGTWFQNIAQTLLVYRLTGSVFLVGIVNLAYFVGVLFLSPSAGVAADRFDRRKLLMTTQITSAAMSGALALLAWSGHINVPIVIGAAVCMGVAQTFSVPAMLSLVPQLVGKDNLGPAVALNIVTFNVARAVGPVLGAVVVGSLGVAAAFGLNALSFFALIIGLLVVTPRRAERRDGPRPRLMETVRSMRDRPDIAVLYLVATCASMTIDPVTTLTPDYATQIFHRSDTLVGWFVGAFGLGAVIAGLWVSRQGIADETVLARRMGILIVSFAVFASTSNLGVALLVMVAAGFGFISLSAAALTRVQRSGSHGEQGRLMALWSMAFMGSRPIASVIDGAVASATNVRFATYLMLLPAIAGLTLLVSRTRLVAAS